MWRAGPSVQTGLRFGATVGLPISRGLALRRHVAVAPSASHVEALPELLVPFKCSPRLGRFVRRQVGDQCDAELQTGALTAVARTMSGTRPSSPCVGWRSNSQQALWTPGPDKFRRRVSLVSQLRHRPGGTAVGSSAEVIDRVIFEFWLGGRESQIPTKSVGQRVSSQCLADPAAGE